eukprot:CAMPEP_0202962544 /NCGR_PEP_ID=MMETSP1396-20130829/6654_1 /ASSEMBLY_ACC=CAM_ASM_000872 /TAXON_ID= /ORGANISM="Pseudokeronopsis sp., Strain Brazil" /LENGTH=112 /DNA_ID=CAMNT_0049683213 /DNA_START=57 /DNA_END=397 /DNA_ORIENTATION=+
MNATSSQRQLRDSNNSEEAGIPIEDLITSEVQLDENGLSELKLVPIPEENVSPNDDSNSYMWSHLKSDSSNSQITPYRQPSGHGVGAFYYGSYNSGGGSYPSNMTAQGTGVR